MALPSITVVVPVRNAAASLPALLDALAAQTLPRQRFEVVVVDDGSGDGTADAAENHRLRPGVVRRERSGGSYAARNGGIAAARADRIAFTDADCRPAADWLAAGLGALDRADVVAGHVDVPLRAGAPLAAVLDASQFLDQERAASQGWAATANLLTHRRVLDAVGLFDERLRSGGDAEWTHRATTAGHRLVHAPDVVVVHAPRDRPLELARKAYRVGRGSGTLQRLGRGPWAGGVPLWRNRGSYRLHPAPPNVARLDAAGLRFGRRHAVARLVLVQLPMALGSLAAQRRR